MYDTSAQGIGSGLVLWLSLPLLHTARVGVRECESVGKLVARDNLTPPAQSLVIS